MVMVELLTGGGATVRTTFTGEGSAVFSGITAGTYVLQVSGFGIQPATVRFDLLPSETQHIEYVHVRPDTDERQGPTSAQRAVSAADLTVPDKAKRELNKGNDAMKHQDHNGAMKHYRKAVEIYPQFAAAQNNLGVACMRTKDYACARAAFEAATKLNPRSASAFMNLARLRMMEHKPEAAEGLLQQSLTADPINPEALTLMAYVELLLGKNDQALLFANKVQTVPMSHFIAAKALEGQRQFARALAEYKIFLQQAPQSPAAANARDAAARLTQAGAESNTSAAERPR
jgi:tetratricopeptide (TPR) repeat protein